MLIFGTIGIFVRYIPLSSALIALTRGVIGTVVILLAALLMKKKPQINNIRKNLLLLVLSGSAIGINWILLFESYRYTTVAVATLCYYMAPVFVTVLSPFILKEKLTLKKALCVLCALMGMVLVSGVIYGSVPNLNGIITGLGAAVFYASVIFMNKFIKDISPYDKTVVQLFAASLVIFIYAIFTQDISNITLDTKSILLLIVVGVVHTGIAYCLYFGSFEGLDSQTIAIYSYIDPALALILSAVFLHEDMSLSGIIGAVMILGSTLLCELNFKKKKCRKVSDTD